MGDADHLHVHSVDFHLQSRLRQVYDRQARAVKRVEIGVGQFLAVHVGAELLVRHRRLVDRVDGHLLRRFQYLGQRAHMVRVGMADDPLVHMIPERRDESSQERRVVGRPAVENHHTAFVGYEYVGVHLRRALRAQLPKGESRFLGRSLTNQQQPRKK